MEMRKTCSKLERWRLKRPCGKDEAELEVAERKMLKVSLGLTRMERISNETLKGITCVGCSGGKCFRHVQGRDRERNLELYGTGMA